MPIEIRELIIRATIGPEKSSGSGPSPTEPSSESSGGQDMTQETVEQVMQILDDKKER